MEYWDLYDENLRPLGRTHRRGEPMEPGTYHIGVDIWVINARGEILLTLRAPEKEDLPNEWENTCGSALAGETAVEAAMRELREETGILAGPDELQEFARRVKGDVHLFTYLLRRDVPLSSLVFQPGETVDAMYVTPKRLDAMVAEPFGARPAGERWPFVRERLMKAIAGL
ncbi:MAG: NUDIX domain-containing protein [Clostridia bacterium]|nr:NUDIX domain-containing protein [Clostridia bacterium]